MEVPVEEPRSALVDALKAQILKEREVKAQRLARRAAGEEVEDEPEEEAPRLALVIHGTGRAMGMSAEPVDSSDSDEAEELPPGPIDPERCEAFGPGFSGASAGLPVKLTIRAKDATGRRIKEGGAYILVMVEAPPGLGGGEDEEEEGTIQAAVVDNNNGTYFATYTVPSKGNYKLHIEINGEPLNGSPFPLFFSAPDPAAQAAAAAAAAAPPPGPPPSAEEAAATAAAMAAAQQQQLQAMGPPQVVTAESLASRPHMMQAPLAIAPLGVQFTEVCGVFPEDPEALGRSVLVGNLAPNASEENLRSMFSLCGIIKRISLQGPNNSFALIEFNTPMEAMMGQSINGVDLLHQKLRVEMASEARHVAEVAKAQPPMPVVNPYLQMQQAMQLQQQQHFANLQQQQMALAEQVAAMRAAARTGVMLSHAPPAPAAGAGGDTQISGALAAAIALSRRLTGGGAAEPAPAAAAATNGSVEKRKRSRSRERRRSRSRDRKPSRQQRSPERRRRTRSRSRQRSRKNRSRSRERSRREAPRRRSASRERRRRRSRDRDGKQSSRHKEKRRERERRSSRGPEEQPAAAAAAQPAEAAAKEAPPPKEGKGDELEELLAELGE